MKRRSGMVGLGVLLMLLILVVASGPLWQAMGFEVFCVARENGRLRWRRCGGDDVLTIDPSPPRLAADARPVLIDTDMAVDDWMAILYLLQRPDVDVRGITVTGAGEAHCEPGVQNALDLAALAGRPDIPVTCGRDGPLAGSRVFPQSWRDRVDALGGVRIPSSPNQGHAQAAAAFIADSIEAAAGDLVIIALGPLTNLAETFMQEPGLAPAVQQIYIMGGAFSVPGNIYDTPELVVNNRAAEWNIYVDPRAAAAVVDSGAPLTFVPLDATNHVRLDEAFYAQLGQDRATSEAEFVYRALAGSREFIRSGMYYFWDPLTAALALDESLGSFERQAVRVIEAEGPESGATRVDPVGRPVRIATAADGEQFKRHFLDVLNGRVD